MYVTMFFVVDIITFFIRTHAKDYLLVQKIARHLFFIFCHLSVFKNTNEIFTMKQHFYEKSILSESAVHKI